MNVVNPFPNDPVNEGILPTAGSDVLYRQATGFERALADVDAQRLTAIYAELVRDQWDPDKISYRNLAYLAWAVGCNLWESDWDETFKRWWVKNQWTLKAQRGSLLGISRFVKANKGEIKHAIRPPAICYPLRSDTDAERAAYVARFPQLRLYPYVEREKLPWLCYCSNFAARRAYSAVTLTRNPCASPPEQATGLTLTLNGSTITFVEGTPSGLQVQIGADLAETLDNLMTLLTTSSDQQIAACEYALVAETATVAIIHKTAGKAGNDYTLAATAPATFMRGMSTLLNGQDARGDGKQSYNGSFLGPLRPLYPTVQNQGGKYTRTVTLWDRGVETTLTMRKVLRVRTGENVGWGFTPGVSAYDEQVTLPLTEQVCFLEKPNTYLGGGAKYGIFPNKQPKLRTITIARSGPLEFTQGKAIYQTVSPQVELLKLEPELVATKHQIRKTELYASRGQFLYKKFLPPSNAWRNVHERWYVFDADRVPDYRRKGVYLNHARLGIHKYTAELRIKIRTKHPRFKTQTSGYIYGFLGGRNDEAINKIRRAVTASMAERDTVLIDTKTVRLLQVGDIIDASGRVYVGQLVSA